MVSPIGAAEALFGGELPVFDSEKDANALIGALIVGLWNRLSEHQERSKPFRLMRVDVPATNAGLARIALIRREEIDSFREGLFGDNESLGLPEPAHNALGVLSQMRAMIEGTRDVAERTANSGEADDAKWPASAIPRTDADRRARDAGGGAVLCPRAAAAAAGDALKRRQPGRLRRVALRARQGNLS